MALSKEGTQRSITVIDNGDGIPSSMHEHIFEPRVTSKLDTSHKDAWGFHGRGMALYSIQVNSLKSEVVSSSEDLGSSIRVLTDTSKLPERTDQSSFPTFDLQEGNTVNVRGPRNLLRCACEFALEARATTTIYIGSPSEIAASLYAYGISTLSALDRAFCHDVNVLPVTKRLAIAADPKEFQSIAESLGLEMSERTARRVLDGQIKPLQPILELIEFNTDEVSKELKKKGKRISKLSLQKEEIDALSSSVLDAFLPIAESYYLDPSVIPNVRVSPSIMTISIPLVPNSGLLRENDQNPVDNLGE